MSEPEEIATLKAEVERLRNAGRAENDIVLARNLEIKTLRARLAEEPPKSDAEQVMAFADELDRLVNRFREEYDMTYAAVVGVLHMKAFLLCAESAGKRDEL